MKKYRVGVLGATGMVGRRLLSLLSSHRFFELVAIAAGPSSAHKTYAEALRSRGIEQIDLPENVLKMTVQCAVGHAESIAQQCDFVFCALALSKDETRTLEERYAKLECPVVSCNSACRTCADVPMVIPEINPTHLEVIPTQRRRLGTKRGFIAVKSNCSVQSFLPPLHAFWDLGLLSVSLCTMQAVSGAGKLMSDYCEMHDNVIPYIPGEQQKTESESLKIWGSVVGGIIVPSAQPTISAQCIRVPVSDGHMAAISFSLRQKASIDELILRMAEYEGEPQRLKLPSAPKQFIHYLSEPDRPQTALDRMRENGMACIVGRLQKDNIFDYKMISLSHNTLRGAAGGAVLLAELLAEKYYFD